MNHFVLFCVFVLIIHNICIKKKVPPKLTCAIQIESCTLRHLKSKSMWSVGQTPTTAPSPERQGCSVDTTLGLREFCFT